VQVREHADPATQRRPSTGNALPPRRIGRAAPRPVVPACCTHRVVPAALGRSRRAGRVLRAEVVAQAIGPSCGRPLDSWRAAAHAVLVGRAGEDRRGRRGI